MLPYQFLLYSITFFLSGIFIASFQLSFLIISLIVLLFCLILIFLTFFYPEKSKFFICLAGLSFFILAGTSYFLFFKDLDLTPDCPDFLLSARKFMVNSFKRVLPVLESKYLTSLMFGEKYQLSQEFRDLLASAGVAHLVAFSGLHLTISTLLITGVISYFFSPGFSLLITIILISLLLLITGFRATALRAGIMMIAYLLASQVGRKIKPVIIVSLTALIIVLLKPAALTQDLGFQFSFLAVLGLIYIKEPLRRFLKMKNQPGILSWREIFLTTSSALIAVNPLLIIKFNQISLVAIVSNLLILGFVPLTLVLGYLIGFSAILSNHLSIILGWFAYILIKYQISVIQIFGRLNQIIQNSLPFTFFTNFGIVALYCLGVIILIYRNKAHDAL